MLKTLDKFETFYESRARGAPNTSCGNIYL